MKMKKLIVLMIAIFTLISATETCFAAGVQYPVKVNTFKIDLDFSKEKSSQTVSLKVDSDIADQLSIEIVDTSFSLANGKTIFTEAAKNPEIEKYLTFEYKPTIQITEDGADVNIIVTPHDLPDGIYYKGVKISYKTNTTISSVLVPVIINNLTPGTQYNTSAQITYVKIDGDYVIKSPFEVCVGLMNDGDKPISNISGTLTVTDANGDKIGEYPISSNTIFFAGAPKEVRVPVTDNLSDGVYTAAATIKYDQNKPVITGEGNFEFKSNFSDSVIKQVVPADTDGKDEIKEKSLPERLTFAVIGALIVVLLVYLIMIMKRKKRNNRMPLA
jgi:hypothetical protein